MKLSRSKLLAGLAVLAAVALGVALWPRQEVSPREQVVRTVVKMTAAAEKRDVAGVMEHVSERFRSDEGWSRDEVKRVVAGQLLRGTWVRVFNTGLEVSTLTSVRAEVKARFVFGRSDAKALADLAKESVLSAYEIEGRLEKEDDGEWRFVWAKHRPLSADELY